MERKTWSPKAHETHLHRDWWIVDAEGLTLGRLASQVAMVIRGKNKPTYTNHMDMGDFVIVVNADKVVLTGKKETQKFYYRHSGFPGGFRQTSVRDTRRTHPERIVQNAVRGMLPKTTLGDEQMRKLKVYAGAGHPHASQQPKPLPIDSRKAS